MLLVVYGVCVDMPNYEGSREELKCGYSWFAILCLSKLGEANRIEH